LVGAAEEIASSALGGLSVEPGEEPERGVDGGALISLLVGDEAAQTGLVADRAACQVLGKLLLGMDPSDEDLSPGDLGDALCELANMLAGGLKRRLAGELPVKLGLPLSFQGVTPPHPEQLVVLRALRIGPAQIHALFVSPPELTTATAPAQ
jgi:Chemotaxis phosphatase CheX